MESKEFKIRGFLKDKTQIEFIIKTDKIELCFRQPCLISLIHLNEKIIELINNQFEESDPVPSDPYKCINIGPLPKTNEPSSP